MEGLRTLNKLLKDKGMTNREVTRFKGEFYLLHILRNDTPVPEIHSRDPQEIKDWINRD